MEAGGVATSGTAEGKSNESSNDGTNPGNQLFHGFSIDSA